MIQSEKREPGWYWVLIQDEWDVVYLEPDGSVRQIGSELDVGFYGEEIDSWGPRLLPPETKERSSTESEGSNDSDRHRQHTAQ